MIELYSYFLLFVFQVMATFHQNMPWDSIVSCLLAIWSCSHPASFKRRMFLSTRNTHKVQWKISYPIWLIPKAFDLKGHRKIVWRNAPLTDCSVFACGLAPSLSIVVLLSKHCFPSASGRLSLHSLTPVPPGSPAPLTDCSSGWGDNIMELLMVRFQETIMHLMRNNH